MVGKCRLKVGMDGLCFVVWLYCTHRKSRKLFAVETQQLCHRKCVSEKVGYVMLSKLASSFLV